MSSRGFTLVELLVALTILALMLGITMNSLSFSLQTSKSVEAAILDTEQTYLATRAFREQLQQAVPLPQTAMVGLDQLDFGGSAKVIEFVAPLRGNRAYAGLHRVRFEIEDDPSFDGNGGRLLMTYRPYAGNTATVNPVASDSVVVLDGFASARFDFGNVTTSTTVDWTPQWVATEQLPALVRLQVDIEGQDDRVAIPEVIVAIRATMPNRLTRGRAR